MGRFYTGMKGPDAVRKLNELDDSFAGALDGTSEIIEQAGNARDDAIVASTAAVSARNLAQQSASETAAEVAAGVLALNAIREGADASRATAVLKATEAAASATAADGARADAVLAREAADVSMMTASAKAAQSASDAAATAADWAVVQTARGEAVQGAIDSLAGADAAEGHAMAAAAILTSVQAHGNGWTPKVALAVDGERRVMRVLSWSGGVGTAPPIGYLAETGVVTDPNLAINVRGGQGAAGTGAGSVTSVNNVPDLEGNVSLAIGDIPGLPQALAAAGQVKTVAGVAPSAGGDVPLTAEDIGAEPAGAADAAVAALGESLAPVALTGSYSDMSGDVVAGKLKLTAGLAEFDGPAGAYRNFRFMTNGAIRFDFGVDNSVESGGNAGSDFYLNAFDDAGGYIGTMLSISRRYGLYAPQINTQTAAVGSNASGVATNEYVDRSTGLLASLETTAKTNLVSAINELNDKVGEGRTAESMKRQIFVAGTGFIPGTTNTLTLTQTPLAPTKEAISVFFDAGYQHGSEWTYNWTTGAIDFTSTIPEGVAQVEVKWSAPLSVGVADSVTGETAVGAALRTAASALAARTAIGAIAASEVGGGVPVGALIAMHSSKPDVVVDGSSTYLRTGVLALASEYPLSPKFLAPTGGIYTTPTLPAAFSAIAYGLGLYVGIAPGDKVYTSPDRINWTATPVPYAAWSLIAFEAGRFLIVAATTFETLTSTTGTSWTAGTIPKLPNGVTGTPLPYSALMAGNGYFLAFSDTTTTMYRSSATTLSWSAATLPATAQWIRGAYGNGKFLIPVRDSSGYALSTDNGASWTLVTSGQPVLATSLIFADGYFIGQSPDFAVIRASTDALTWVNYSGVVGGSRIARMAFGGGVYVGVPRLGTTIWTAESLSVWASATAPLSDFVDIVYGAAGFLGITANGAAIASVAGAEYTETKAAMFADPGPNTRPFYMRVK